MKMPGMIRRLLERRSAASQSSRDYPYLLSGETKGMLVQLRPSLMANIVAMAEAHNIASVLVTESYERSPELVSVKATLENAAWIVEVRVVSASEVRNRYGQILDAYYGGTVTGTSGIPRIDVRLLALDNVPNLKVVAPAGARVAPQA